MTEKNKQRFYKFARPDGFDFWTGKTINYRESIGKTVRRPTTGKMRLCSDTVIHASRDPNQCFVGASIPCSAYLVEGKPYVEDSNKCGFKQLRIIKELKPEKLFKWRYKEACNPLNPFDVIPPKKILKKHLSLLKKWDSVWASVWASAWASAWDSVWASVWDSVWASAWASAWDSVWDSVGDSVWDSVWVSVRDSVWAYVGYVFQPVIKEWKEKYPLQSVIDLWKMGLAPSYDGEKWRLHGGKKAEILWEGKIK